MPIAADSAPEQPERFEIVLESPTGGAGLGATGIDVEIVGSSYPRGDFAFVSGRQEGAEGDVAGLWVERRYYAEGPVSVEVRLSGGSAEAGRDFTLAGSGASNTVVLQWGDGEGGVKSFDINLRRDKANESLETIELELASPQGGAMLATPSRVTVDIVDTSPVRGGGIFAGIEALLLGILAALTRRWGSARRS